MTLKAKSVLSLIGRDYRIARSYRLAFLLDTFFGLLNLITFFFISQVFEGERPEGLGPAPDYFAFVAVGLAIALVLQAASTGLARRIREEQLVGTLEVLVVQPISSAELAMGLAGFPFAFAMARAVIYLLIAGLFLQLDISQANWIGLVGMLFLAAAAFIPLGIALGALVIVFKRGEVLAAIVTFGLGLLSGALFPIAELPGWAGAVGRVLPTRFAFDGVRAALFKGHGYGNDMLALTIFIAVGMPLAIAGFSRSLEWARSRGTLSQY